MKALVGKGFIGVWPALLAAFLVAGCASSGFRAEVTRFHNLGAPRGERIAIEPAEGIENGLEFGNYAAQLAAYFANYGYLTGGKGPPRIIATLGWFADPDPNYYAGSGPVIGVGFAGAGRHVGGGISTSTDLSDDDGLYYRHTITLVMTDLASGERIFEGRASGHTYGEYWPGMMPRLLGALFLNWPGVSGATETIKLPDY